jgi:hypothetical protein
LDLQVARKNENTANPIAAKLVGKMKRAVNGKVVNLRSFIAGRAAAEELQKQVVTEEQLAGCHPAQAAYVYAQNQVSVMSEQLTGMRKMAPFAHIVSEAEDLIYAKCAADEPAHDLLLHLRRRTRWGRLQIHPNLARHPWRAHRGPGVRWFRSIRRGQIPSLESCMASVGKYLLY